MGDDQTITATQDPPPGGEDLDLGYQVAIDQFSGPLDLLLYLVKRTEVDIVDIPIATITDQFVETVMAWQAMDLEVAGDFIVMAATLIELKARQLAPPPETAEGEEPGDDFEDVLDPKADLIQRLLQYRRFKDAALLLDEHADLRARQAVRLLKEAIPEDPATEPEVELTDLDVHQLYRSFELQMARISGLGPRRVVFDEVPIDVRIQRVIERLQAAKHAALREFFDEESSRGAKAGVMVASLEVVRQRFAEVTQVEQYGDVDLRWREPEEREIAQHPPAAEGEDEPLGRRRRQVPLVTFTAGVGDDADLVDEPEERVETDEQRFLRELDESCDLSNVLATAADAEGAFIAAWQETHNGDLPPTIAAEHAAELARIAEEKALTEARAAERAARDEARAAKRRAQWEERKEQILAARARREAAGAEVPEAGPIATGETVAAPGTPQADPRTGAAVDPAPSGEADPVAEVQVEAQAPVETVAPPAADIVEAVAASDPSPEARVPEPVGPADADDDGLSPAACSILEAAEALFAENAAAAAAEDDRDGAAEAADHAAGEGEATDDLAAANAALLDQGRVPDADDDLTNLAAELAAAAVADAQAPAASAAEVDADERAGVEAMEAATEAEDQADQERLDAAPVEAQAEAVEAGDDDEDLPLGEDAHLAQTLASEHEADDDDLFAGDPGLTLDVPVPPRSGADFDTTIIRLLHSGAADASEADDAALLPDGGEAAVARSLVTTGAAGDEEGHAEAEILAGPPMAPVLTGAGNAFADEDDEADLPDDEPSAPQAPQPAVEDEREPIDPSHLAGAAAIAESEDDDEDEDADPPSAPAVTVEDEETAPTEVVVTAAALPTQGAVEVTALAAEAPVAADAASVGPIAAATAMTPVELLAVAPPVRIDAIVTTPTVDVSEFTPLTTAVPAIIAASMPPPATHPPADAAVVVAEAPPPEPPPPRPAPPDPAPAAWQSPPSPSSTKPLPTALPTHHPAPAKPVSCTRKRIWMVFLTLVLANGLGWGLWTTLAWVPRDLLEVSAPMQVEGDGQWHFRFNLDAVAPEQVGTVPGQAPMIEPAVAGSWTWTDARTLTFAPTQSLPPGLALVVRWSRDHLRSPQKLRLGQDLACILRTPPLVPRSAAVVAFDEAGTQTLDLGFDRPVEPARLTGRIRVTDADDVEHTATVLSTTPSGIIRVRIGGAETAAAAGGASWGLTPAPATAPAVDAPLRLDASWSAPVHLGHRLHVTAADASLPARGDGSIALTLDHPEAPRDVLADSISVEPAVPFRVVETATGLRLDGPFAPGETYAVLVAARHPSEPGQDVAAYPAASRHEVAMPKRSPGLWLGGSVERLAVTGVNVGTVVVVVSDGEGAEVAQQILQLPESANAEVSADLAFRDLVSVLPPGTYRVHARGAGVEAEARLAVRDVPVAEDRWRRATAHWAVARLLGDRDREPTLRLASLVP